MTRQKNAKREYVSTEASTTSANDIKRSKTESVAAVNSGAQGCAKRPPRLSSQLPLTTQHDLLQHVQHLLEDMCQRFGMKWCPQEMQKHRWTEKRSLELQCWVKFLKKHSSCLPISVSEPQASALETLLFTKVANIRHLGVHRRALELPTILDHLVAACTFAELHQDIEVNAGLSSIVRALQNIHGDLMKQQDSMREVLQRRITQIRLQQAELEHQAELDTEQDNSRRLVEAGSKIDDLLRGGWRLEEDTTIPRGRSPFSDGSEIDAILTEAAARSSVS